MRPQKGIRCSIGHEPWHSVVQQLWLLPTGSAIPTWHTLRLRSHKTTCTLVTDKSTNFDYRLLLTGIQFVAELKCFHSVNISIKHVIFPADLISQTVKLTPHLHLLITLTMHGTFLQFHLLAVMGWCSETGQLPVLLDSKVQLKSDATSLSLHFSQGLFNYVTSLFIKARTISALILPYTFS